MGADYQAEQANPEGERIPRHVAIIMDGNGRWAQARGQARHQGHRAGLDAVKAVVEQCGRRGVGALTLFAFSSENWQRPRAEVRMLMELFMRTLDTEAHRLSENNVRLRVIGDRAQFSDRLQERLAEAERLTADKDGLHLTIAASYGGRWDILQAARRAAEEAMAGRLDPASLTESDLAGYLSLAELPEPDLFIRTGGEKRISNFLLWQLAYTELYFTETLWPDFRAGELDRALADFARRQRRFGLTDQQLRQRDRA
ncbi:di-trans,poly-cis-decaprenylcistransferase [Ectothiorhodospiraceae bacterium WFHF3C12]|nr:di-trans,poly-cis-decaprenylcistransferase [Ectothiorhodospiraceae bacterium WFHF3C12]